MNGLSHDLARYIKSPKDLAATLLLCLIVTYVNASTGNSDQIQVLNRFIGESASKPWPAVNDGVMGGASEGAARLTSNGMLFSGNLSLENHGGFSSIRQQVELDLAAFSGIRVKILGDGRTYQLRLESDARYRDRWPVSFSGDIQTVAGKWVEVDIPFDQLRQSWRGRQLSDYTFNPAEIQMIGLMLADQQPGEFGATVEWIAAYR